jgi:hypothetical protein
VINLKNMPEDFRDASDDLVRFVAVFKKFGEGWYRLVIVLWLAITILFGLLGAADEEFIGFIIAAPIAAVSYYILVRIILWVYLGFKKD